MTFQDYLTTQRDSSEKTIEAYSQDLRDFFKWWLIDNPEPFKPTDLTATDVRLYKQSLMARRVGPATVNRRLAALRAYGDYLVANHILYENPAAAARGVNQQKLAPRWLDKKEQAALTRHMEKQISAAQTSVGRWEAIRNKAIVVFLLNTGLRVSELCALAPADISVSERKGTATVRDGKGNKARVVPLNRAARSALDEWGKIAWRKSFIFCGRDGIALGPRGVQKMLRIAGRRCDVLVTPHRLRHTFAKSLLDSGVPLETIAALMGHERIETTRGYTRPGESDLQKAVGVLDD